MPTRPSDAEEEYFKLEEIQKLRKLRKQAAADVIEEERHRLRELHWMHCPKCGMELAEVEFRGVVVDACFACEGMFFDKGEVDKLHERTEPGWLGGMLSHLFGKWSRTA